MHKLYSEPEPIVVYFPGRESRPIRIVQVAVADQLSVGGVVAEAAVPLATVFGEESYGPLPVLPWCWDWAQFWRGGSHVKLGQCALGQAPGLPPPNCKVLAPILPGGHYRRHAGDLRRAGKLTLGVLVGYAASYAVQFAIALGMVVIFLTAVLGA